MPTAHFICGTAGPSFGVSSLAIPITTTVPRTDPILGGSVVWIYYTVAGDVSPSSGVSDDAAPFDAYSFCLYTDGLNYYGPFTFPTCGLIVNPLIGGVNTITLTFPAPVDYIQAVAVAITGIGGSWPAPPLDGIDPNSFIAGATAEAPFPGPATSTSSGGTWILGSHGGGPTDPYFISPFTATTDQTWDWRTGEYAFYFGENSEPADPLGWTWTDVQIANYSQWSFVDPGSGNTITGVLGIQDPITPGAQAPSVRGTWGSGLGVGLTGRSRGPLAGAGPPPCVVPPAVNYPVFENHYRAAALATDGSPMDA